MSVFSERTIGFLKTAGWVSGRHIDTSAIENELREQGYQLFPAISRFLQEFGNLRVIFPRQRRVVLPKKVVDHTSRYYLAIEPLNIAKHYDGHDSQMLQAYERAVDTTLCVIGWYGTDMYFTLMMDPLGKVYGGWDDWLLLAGETGEIAIENLVSKDENKLPKVDLQT